MCGARSKQAQVLFLSDDLKASRARLLALGVWNIGGDVESILEAAALKWAGDAYNLLVIDAHTRAFGGIAACLRLRGLNANPMLLVAYADDERDKINAYEAGADEFIAKPIGLPLFVCKVKAWLRQSKIIPAPAQPHRAFDHLQSSDLHSSSAELYPYKELYVESGLHSSADVCLDPIMRQITVGRTTIPLSNLELRLMRVLIAHEGQVLSGEVLLEKVWGLEGGDQSVLKNAVYRLRRKIACHAPGAPRFLHTVRGKGYLLKVE